MQFQHSSVAGNKAIKCKFSTLLYHRCRSYEEQWVQWQEFVDWVCSHPVLSQCEVWHHFLTCNDDKMWKSGKTKRGTFVGVSHCCAISPPENTLLPSLVDAHMERCSQFMHAMDISVRNLLARQNVIKLNVKNNSNV